MNTRICISILLLAAAGAAQAQSASPEDRLRDQLRQTVLQLRQIEDENADLKARLAAAAPAPTPEAAESPKLRRELQLSAARSASLEQQLDSLQKVLEQWKQAYQLAMQQARSRDADAHALETQLKDSQSGANTCADRNAQLVRISDELLQRYKDKGVWDSLRNEEPLTGVHRVALEKLAQDYHGRIVDATVASPATPVE